MIELPRAALKAGEIAEVGEFFSFGTNDLHACERIVVTFVQLKNYLGSYWLVPWFFVYIYPSILVYE